jgi:hypothetical protein
VIPDGKTLAKAYQMFAASDRLSEAFKEVKNELADERYEPGIKVPDDLAAQIEAKLKEKPDITWHRAVRLIVDPDAPDDEDADEDDDGERDDEEDPGEIDE